MTPAQPAQTAFSPRATRKLRPSSPRKPSRIAIPAELETLRGMIDARLDTLLEPGPLRISAAMRSAALSPGKRMRPLLTLLAAAQCGGPVEAALDAACAIEMIHAASLILDDLPCMDDATLRRGRPATHLAYGEDIAILAAIGLLNAAYGAVAGSQALDCAQRSEIGALLAGTVGPCGLIGGQEFDLRDRADTRDVGTIARQNHAKTGVLLEAAVDAGAIAARGDALCREALRAYAGSLGAAFQMMDDLLDCTSTPDVLKKDVGKDAGRATVVALFGAEGARSAVRTHVEAACAALAAAPFGSGPLARFTRSSVLGLA
jgi:geranylgeranyl diphosphate synthase, type II